MVLLVSLSIGAGACADLRPTPAATTPLAPARAPTEIVAYFDDGTVSAVGSPSAAASDLHNAVTPVAIQRRAVLKVFPLDGNTFASGIAIATTDFSHLSDNPDERNRQVNEATKGLFAAMVKHAAQPSGTTDIVGIFRAAAFLQAALPRGGHLLVAVGGDAVPTTPACDSQLAPDDPAAAGALAAACLGDAPVRDDGVQFWFLSAGQSTNGQFNDTNTITTRNLLISLVHQTGGLLCPFQPDPIAPGSCR